MTFTKSVATIEGETSSHIAEMIEELTQPEDSEVPRISIEVIPVNLTVVAGESSLLGDLPGDLQEGLSSLIPRLGKI